MHPRRFTAFILGLWLAAGVAMALIAAGDDWLADRLVDQPSAGLVVAGHAMGLTNARMLFHYQADEQKRRNYELWEIAQILIGLLFFLFVLFGTSESKAAIGASLALLLLVLIQRFFLYSAVASLSRELDFLPASAPTPTRAKLAVLLSFYGGVEVAKWVIQSVMAGRLIFAHRRMESDNIRNYVNPINKANYRHINR